MAEIRQTDGVASDEEKRETEAEGLQRELAGAHRRLDELKATEFAHPKDIAAAEEVLQNVTAEIKRLGDAKSKRPRARKETR